MGAEDSDAGSPGASIQVLDKKILMRSRVDEKMPAVRGVNPSNGQKDPDAFASGREDARSPGRQSKFWTQEAS